MSSRGRKRSKRHQPHLFHRSSKPIDRRQFVRTAGGLVVATSLGCAADPLAPQGKIDLTINGLDASATSGGRVVAVAQAPGTDTYTIDIPKAGHQLQENVLAGTYNVTYTPPGNHAVVGTVPATIVVTADATTFVTLNLSYTPPPPGSGTIAVTVTGLSGAPNGGSALCHRTDAAGTDFTINVSASTGQGTNNAVPPGTYTITYTPPAGYAVTGGTTNPATGKVVTTGATTSVSFGVQVTGGGRPAPLFRSDWSTATGSSDNALLDQGKTLHWDEGRNNYAADLAVVSAAGLGFPASMTNVLRHKFTGGAATGRAALVTLLQKWTTIPIGGTLYLRFYFRADYLNEVIADPSGSSHHNFEGDNKDMLRSIVLFHPGSSPDGTYEVRVGVDTESFPTNNWSPNTGAATTRLTKGVVYRWEWAVTRATATKLSLKVRLYGANDSTLLYPDTNGSETKMVCSDSSKTLLIYGANINYSDASWLNSWELGNNGWLASFSTDCYDYFGGVCFRTDDWCGPYNTTDG